ncbi:hypothetical protein N4G70_28970 [Streptomyces sp. ASQP_92]|uniref:hypothetical protein n=1 Tax=Streptomyces sp. ASQP_92 TaxID=2979116 RepID=UPI0021C19392|nr:hypothetical protein [Streptomyces sp. ASQP_92]MCT9092873.1 hypothetical protein [Streptomyces sp. ASQP_92]
MAFERISRINETPDGSFVYAQADLDANAYRVVCSSCPELQETPYRSSAGAILAASYHAEHDPNQKHVPTR